MKVINAKLIGDTHRVKIVVDNIQNRQNINGITGEDIVTKTENNKQDYLGKRNLFYNLLL